MSEQASITEMTGVWGSSFTIVCVLAWLRRRKTAFPICDFILRDASGRHPTEKTYCQSIHGSPLTICQAGVHYITSVRCTVYAHSTYNKDCSHSVEHFCSWHADSLFPKGKIIIIWVFKSFKVIFLKFLNALIVKLSTHVFLSVFVFFSSMSDDFNLRRVWFFSVVFTVDAINDTMAAFYNDTDLFSGELWHPLVFTPLWPGAPNS